MKRQLFKKLLLVILLVGMAATLVSGAGRSDLIENLVGQRIEIMNAFFNGDMNARDASEALRRVERGRLLAEDLQAMKDYFQTDVEEILDYRITVPKITYQDEDIITALVQVVWTTKGLPLGEEEEAVRTDEAYYSVILEKSENSYKIVQFF